MGTMQSALLKLRDHAQLGEMVQTAVASAATDRAQPELARSRELPLDCSPDELVQAYECNLTELASKHNCRHGVGQLTNGARALAKDNLAEVIRVLWLQGKVFYLVRYDEPQPVEVKGRSFLSCFALLGEEHISPCSCRGYLKGHERCSPAARKHRSVQAAAQDKNG